VTWLKNEGWWKGFVCVMLMNALFVAVYVNFMLDTRIKFQENLNPSTRAIPVYSKSQNFHIMLFALIITLFLINIFYFLTQFLNPGIKNLAHLPA
jgi:cyanate permease